VTDTHIPPVTGKLSFDPYNQDGSPRRYVGMFRPTLDEAKMIDPMKGYRSMGGHPQFYEEWYHGDFDRPLYEEPAE
jgi:hypothetical protein